MKSFIYILLGIIILVGCKNKEKNNSENHNHVEKSEAECIVIPANDTAKFISKQLIVKGTVTNEILLTVDSLKKMNSVILDSSNVICHSGATTSMYKTRRGVLLKDIIDKAIIKQENHKDRNFIIVARATDNYKATFSWAEIYNNPTGLNTYVLFEEDGKPIQTHGEMKLFCANDIKTGPRQVVWLKSIEISRVN